MMSVPIKKYHERLLFIFIFFPMVMGTLASHLTAQTKPLSPNIVIFMADDLTYRDIGCYGSPDAQTPRIDSFATQGMLFQRCYQAVAMCSPTRSNLMTGLYPVKNGAYPNHGYARESTLSVVQYMKPRQYRSALLGKKHIGPESVFPFEYLSHSRDEIDFGYMDRFLSEVTQTEEPFLLFVCSHQPHLPYTKGDPFLFDPNVISLPPNFVDTRETREEYVKYLAEIKYLDDEFGRSLDLLAKYGLEENTIVIFISEHGHSFPFAKWTCYNNGLQSAFLIRWPGKIQSHTIADALIEYVDIVPTLMDLVGLTPPSHLDGRSFRKVLEGRTRTHKKYVFGLQTTRGINHGPDYYGIRTVSDGRYRYILNLTPEVKFQNNIILDNSKNRIFNSWKDQIHVDPHAKEMVRRYEYRPPEELYDLSTDPYEMVNLIDLPDHQRIRKRLRKQLFLWMDSQGDQGQETELEAFNHIRK